MKSETLFNLIIWGAMPLTIAAILLWSPWACVVDLALVAGLCTGRWLELRDDESWTPRKPLFESREERERLVEAARARQEADARARNTRLN